MKKIARFIFLCFLSISPASELIGSTLREETIVGGTSASFLGCRPLKNLETIDIYPIYVTTDSNLRANLYLKITELLSKSGTVKQVPVSSSFKKEKLSKPQAEIKLFISPVSDEDGKELSVKLSLWVVANTLIEETGQQCLCPVWMVDAYLASTLDKLDDKKVVDTSITLLEKFLQDLKNSNESSKKAPTFYLRKL